MNIANTILHLLTTALCLGICGSVLIHDTNTDKAVLARVANRAPTLDNVVIKPGNDPHTHSERGSLYQAVRDIHSSQPRTQPRSQDKKYTRAKPSARGHHPFDNYTLPIVD